MLYLTRKIGESIVINDDIELTVVEVRGKSIKLGLTFPSDVTVYRREVYDRIQAEKRGEVPPRRKGPQGAAQPTPAAQDRAQDRSQGTEDQDAAAGEDPPLAQSPRKVAQNS